MEQDFPKNNSYNLFKTAKDLEGTPKRPYIQSLTNRVRNKQISTKY